ncbi:T9SS C-terminal target domain-containing protein [Olleya aquimaris]|nr:T9SS C-terminal target domain-containing protein [Olleya aquimaris]
MQKTTLIFLLLLIISFSTIGRTSYFMTESNTTASVNSSIINTSLDNNLSIQDPKLNYFVKQDLIKITNNTSFKQYEVYNILGKKVLQKKDHKYIETINISDLAKGVYILKMSNNNTFKTLKFIKQ